MAQDQPGWAMQTLLGNDATQSTSEPIARRGRTPTLLFTASHGTGFRTVIHVSCPIRGIAMSRIGQDLRSGASPFSRTPTWRPMMWGMTPDSGLLFPSLPLRRGHAALGTDFDHQASRQAPLTSLHMGSSLVCRNNSSATPREVRGGGRPRRSGPGAIPLLWSGRGGNYKSSRALWKRLMEGHPVVCTPNISTWYAELSSDLSVQIRGKSGSARFPTTWRYLACGRANNVAPSYVIIGDPAVRFPCYDGTTPVSAAYYPRITSCRLAPS